MSMSQGGPKSPTQLTEHAQAKARVIREMEQGLTLKDAAALVGVHRTTVARWRHKDEVFSAAVRAARASTGIALTRSGPRSDKDYEDQEVAKAAILSAMEQGLSYGDALKGLGVNRSAVWRWKNDDDAFDAAVETALDRQRKEGAGSYVNISGAAKNPPTGALPTDKSLPYLAGFLDGEGCFEWRSSSGLPNGAPALQCANTYPPVLHMLQRRFGGRVSKSRPAPQAPHPRNAWVWQVTGVNCRRALKILSPLLLEKKTQVDLLLRAWSERGDARLPLIAAVKAAKRPLFTGDEGRVA